MVVVVLMGDEKGEQEEIDQIRGRNSDRSCGSTDFGCGRQSPSNPLGTSSKWFREQGRWS